MHSIIINIDSFKDQRCVPCLNDECDDMVEKKNIFVLLQIILRNLAGLCDTHLQPHRTVLLRLDSTSQSNGTP